MIIANVRDVARELRKAFDPLTGRQVAQAASSAINKTLSKDRVFIGREIRQVYNMNTFDAKNEIPQTMSTINTLTGKLSGNAGFTPMEYFKISGDNSLTGQGFKVKRQAKYAMVNGKRKVVGRSTSSTDSGRHSTFEVSIMKNKTSLFKHAFLANTKNGLMLFNRGRYNSRTNVFGNRTGRLPIDRLRTLSVWQEIRNKGIEGRSVPYLKTEFTKEYQRLLILRMSGHGAWR